MKIHYQQAKYLLLFIIVIIVPISTVLPQDDNQQRVEGLFENALNQFNSGNFNQALEGFNQITAEYDYNSKTTVSEFFKARILFQMKRFMEFKEVTDSFLEKYPNSRYTDEIRLLLVKYNLEVANYYNAFKETLFTIEKSDSPYYENKARTTGEAIAAKYMNDSQLNKLYSEFTSAKLKSYILLQSGKYFIRTGDSFSAKSTFSDLMKNYPESVEFEEAKRLYDFSYDSQPPSKVIGVMLPLETNLVGEFTSQPASEILEGIKFAVNEFNSLRSDKVGLIIRDTKKDVEEIKKIRKEFTSFNSLIAIIGPIFSNEVRTVLEEFDDYDIPIISPTATDDDLTSLNHNFFQANPSFSVRGKVMAQFIFYVENKRAVSVINSIDGYSPLLAANFAEEFEKLGGKVLRRESFKDSTTDFSQPLLNIYRDSLTIEGIYFPLSDNSVTPYIFSELIKHNVNIPIYGNQDWFTAKGFETAPQISNNLVFTSDYFVDFNSDEYFAFNDKYVSVTGKDINRNVLYGYDATKFLLTALRNSDFNRENLRAKMTTGMVSSGMKNNISFDERRINRFLNIVRYREGLFELLDKFRLN